MEHPRPNSQIPPAGYWAPQRNTGCESLLTIEAKYETSGIPHYPWLNKPGSPPKLVHTGRLFR
jgi:hypothetical protein